MTHDLLKNLFTVFDGKILRVEIIALKEDIFYGNIVAEANNKIVDIDSRPSDAIALAVRAHVPILVSQEIMDAAGVVPERDMQTEGPAAPADDDKPLPASPTEGEQGLDVFEDFLKKLKDNPGDEEEKPKS
jgi:bifunctional DNase/RNase